jgi:MoaA/NifB/PqqE/SkfB family radical SAM enzyme
MDEVIKNDDGKPMSLLDNVASDGWNSKWLSDLREDFIADKKPEACYSCWTAEDAGVDSKRQRALRDYPDEQGAVRDKPIAMDLKLGNICNNKCRICCSYASSLWVPEEKKRDGENNLAWDNMRKVGRWPEHNQDFWDDFEEISNECETLEFYGGEPFLIEKHYEILEKLVETGRSKDMKLSYNTNGSIYPTRGVELWPHFKEVRVSFSIDGTYEHFNYIRHPADFEKVQANMKALLDQEIGGLFVDVCYTVSIFNIFYMNEILDWRDICFPDIPVYFNHVYTPRHLSCKVLPDSVKDTIKEQYAGTKYEDHPDIVSTLKYLTDASFYDETTIGLFFNHTSFSDRFRKESFAKTFPEYYDVLKRIAPKDF